MQEEPYLGKLVPGVSVCDVAGNKVGTVERVYRRDPTRMTTVTGEEAAATAVVDEVVEVKTGPFGLGKHLYVPMGAIDAVTEEGVFLNKPREEVKDAWTTPPAQLDQLH
jgi:hypothetical protein